MLHDRFLNDQKLKEIDEKYAPVPDDGTVKVKLSVMRLKLNPDVKLNCPTPTNIFVLSKNTKL